MPVYVYGCPTREHERVELVRAMDDDTPVHCLECGAVMGRVPQAFRWGRSSWEVLAEHMDKKYIEWREKRRKGLRRG